MSMIVGISFRRITILSGNKYASYNNSQDYHSKLDHSEISVSCLDDKKDNHSQNADGLEVLDKIPVFHS